MPEYIFKTQFMNLIWIFIFFIKTYLN